MEGYGFGFNIRFPFCPLQDKVAMESIPLLGFTIAPEKEAGSNEAGPVFHLYHKKTLFYSFKAEDSNSAQRYQQRLVLISLSVLQRNAVSFCIVLFRPMGVLAQL